jgi:Fe(3+) dicitrate transport protein
MHICKTITKMMFFILLALVVSVRAQDNNQTVKKEVTANKSVFDNVTIIGRISDIADIPGSVHVIDQEKLAIFIESNIMNVLRTVPGVYIQDEEGFGLRPNIGIRGSGLDRSSRIAILEDGILIAPAPYAAPSAYYFPTQRRIHSLEVLKGPASIGIGPRTTGGAINLISTPIPDSLSGTIDFRIGKYATSDTHINFGDHGRRFSWLIETVQSASDGFKHIDGATNKTTGYDLEDYILKTQFDSEPSARFYQSLYFKAGHTKQIADETYLGLTDNDFIVDPNRRYAASANDVFESEHNQLQLSYVIDSKQSWRSKITIYQNIFSRNWYKLQSVNGRGIGSILADTNTYASEFDYLKGNDSPNDAIVKRNNNRNYYSQGIQAEVEWNFQFSDTELNLTAGMRLHEDEEDRFQDEDGYRMQNLQLIMTSDGAPGSTTNRISSAEALSFFIDTEILTGNWIFTPGLRFEDIDMLRLDYPKTDPTRTIGPSRIRQNSITVFIPGIGVLYRLNAGWRLLAGIHKGFNPPSPGSNATEESSLNFELGSRYDNGRFKFESIYFFNDYNNLVGTVTASTGGNGEIGDQFDGGEITVQGLELSADYSFIGFTNDKLDLPVSLRYTWTTDAKFKNTFDSSFDPWGNVRVGDALPYIPEHQFSAIIGIRSKDWTLNFSNSYTSKMRSVASQSVFNPKETIDPHFVWDMLASWQITSSIRAYLKVNNLFDKTYIAARRPAGVRPGLERITYLGITLRI